ncbi:DUF4173 domain-containing protein [Aquihabitans sp. McL0605]|uniref:DUF4153 domain-containing protein n=1 Tax=Aquihabitans sp. McL0605 TaxID=3415671 RepID=UPI003CECF165
MAAGVLLEVGLRGGVANVLVAAGAVLVVIALVTDRRIPNRPSRAVAAAAVVPLGFLAVRSSPWLATSNVVLATTLVAVAIGLSRSGSVSDTTLGRLVRRWARAIPSAWSGPRALAPVLPEVSATSGQRAARVGVAALVCVPVLALVVLLLAAADPVFAGLLTPDLHVGPVVGHLVWTALLAALAACVVGAAASDAEDPESRGGFGVLETATMLALTAAVLGLFVTAQLVAVTSAGQRLVDRSGLTPAEYARSGFFQLCWATGLILSLLAVIRRLAAPGVMRAPLVRILAAVVPCLALGLVVVSLRRLGLYDDAFGLTMLRLWVMGAAVWMGVVLLFIAARNAGVAWRREWVLGASLLVGAVLVVAADAADPEAFVVRHNVARAEHGADLDARYLASLSDDAVPALVARWGALGPDGRPILEPALRCDEPPAGGAAALNASVRRAEELRRQACNGTAGP